MALANRPKRLKKPSVNILNGSCTATSAPLSEAPEPLTVVLIVQMACDCLVGSIAAGDEGRSTEDGRPVWVKVAFEMLLATGKLAMSFLNSATDRIAPRARYHSTNTS